MAILTSLLWAAAAVAFIAMIIAWARGRVHDAEVAREAVEHYYQAAQQLIKDDKVSDDVVSFVEYLGSQAAHPDLARRFAFHVLRAEKRDRASESERVKRFERDLQGLSVPNKERFARVVACAMIASAASDPILSPLFRRFLMAFLSVSGRQEATVSVERANTVAFDLARGPYAAAA